MTDATDDETTAEKVKRLRAENAALRKQLEQTTERKERRGRRWLSITCAVLGALMLLLSAVTVWTRNTVLDTDQYVATVKPLATDEDVQNAVSSRVADELATALDFQTVAEDALPDDAAVLAGPIASGAKSLVEEAVRSFVQTQAFERIWEDANRLAHENVVAVMTGEGGDLVSTEDGKIVLDLRPLADEVLTQLGETFGTDLTDSVSTEDLPIEFTLVESQDLADAQGAVRAFDALSWATLILALAFLVGTVALAADRRRGAVRLGLAVVISMAVAGLLYTFVRNEYLSALPAEANQEAATAVFDILTRFLQRAIRTLFVIGVLTLLGAWVVGPSAAAARVRSWWDTLLGRATEAGADREVGPVPIWVAAHERSLQIGVAFLAVLTIVTWTRPTGLVVLLVAIVALLAAGVVRLVAQIGYQADPGAFEVGESAAAPDDGQADEADTVDA